MEFSCTLLWILGGWGIFVFFYLCCQDTYGSNFIAFLGKKKKSLQRLQLVQNAAARILTHMRQMQMQSVTPVLKELHWAPLLKKKIKLFLKPRQRCIIWDLRVCWSCCLRRARKPVCWLFTTPLKTDLQRRYG